MNLDFYAHIKRGWVIFPSHKVIVYLKDVCVLSINLENVFLGIVYLKMFIKKLSVPFWRIMPYWLGLNVYLVVMADVPWAPLGSAQHNTHSLLGTYISNFSSYSHCLHNKHVFTFTVLSENSHSLAAFHQSFVDVFLKSKNQQFESMNHKL